MYMTLSDLIEATTILGESGDPLPYQLVRNNNDEILYTFEYGGVHWFVDFQKHEIGHRLGITVAEITFYENPQNKLVFDTTKKFAYSGSVFGTVTAVIRDALDHLDVVVFIGADDRISLYKKLVRKFATTHHAYRVDDPFGSLWVVCRDVLQPDILDVIQQHSTNIVRNKV